MGKTGESCVIRAKELVRTLAEVELCVQKLHWHVRSASSVTTILPRKRRIIPTGWKSGSIADSAGSTRYTKKQNKFPGNKVSFLETK